MSDRASFDAPAFFAALDAQRDARGMSWRDVAREAGISPSTPTRLSQGKRPDVDTFAALVDWLGIGAGTFVRRTHPENQPETRAAISVLLHADASLSPKRATAMVSIVGAVYEAFRAAAA